MLGKPCQHTTHRCVCAHAHPHTHFGPLLTSRVCVTQLQWGAVPKRWSHDGRVSGNFTNHSDFSLGKLHFRFSKCVCLEIF